MIILPGHEIKEKSFTGQYNTRKFSYADYLAWGNQERLELIEGVAYAMTPSPSRIHQKIVVELARQISNFLIDKTCEVYVAPFDVRFSPAEVEENEVENVVQPDLSVICDKNKLDDKGCNGSPDLIIEVVSPSSVAHDYIRKLNLYEKYSVQEYWIVHPIDKIIMVYRLEGSGKYSRPLIYGVDEAIPVGVVTSLTLSLSSIYEDEHRPV